MINPQLLKGESLRETARRLLLRGYELDVGQLECLENQRKSTQSQVENLRAQRNKASREVGIGKSQGADVSMAISKVEEINQALALAEVEMKTIFTALEEIYWVIPNILDDTVPEGKTEAENVVIRTVGTCPQFSFPVADHVTLGERLGMIDFPLATRLASARFSVLSDDLARLHRVLGQFMLDFHLQQHGYREFYMPFMANPTTLAGTGQLPKFEEDLFHAERDQLYLIPTAEVMLTNIVQDRLVNKDELPMRLVCHTPCFRREAGSYGQDTRGLLRQHQFEKVELVHITNSESSYDALEELTANAEKILQVLELPYRIILLCSGDTGFAAAKTYDIEVWLPGQNKYREISSCSNCEDFQSRRMKARFKDSDGKNKLLHTLNGSGIAVGRTLIAVMENYQTEAGDIIIPDVLQPYMNGLKRISANHH